MVVKNRLTGIKAIDQTTIEVASGENWHNFVEWSLKNSTFGLENLALIPGTVGAGPIQNIGAYGSEISNYVKEVCVLNTKDGSVNVLSNQDCKFGYRTSVFKSKPELFILSVTFELDHRPKINVSYESLHNEILKMEIDKNQLNILLGIGGSGPTKRIPSKTFLKVMEKISHNKILQLDITISW